MGWIWVRNILFGQFMRSDGLCCSHSQISCLQKKQLLDGSGFATFYSAQYMRSDGLCCSHSQTSRCLQKKQLLRITLLRSVREVMSKIRCSGMVVTNTCFHSPGKTFTDLSRQIGIKIVNLSLISQNSGEWIEL